MKTAIYTMRLGFGIALFAATVMPYQASTVPASDDDCLPKFPPPPVVKIKVRVAACSEPGRHIEYRICVENCSPSEAHHVTVKDAIPSNTKFVRADPAPSKQEPELQWNLGTIGGGGVREIVLVLQPTNKEDVKNCARVQFEHGQCVVTRQAASAPGSRPPLIQTVPPEAGSLELPILELSIRGPKEQYANLPTRYEITLTNKGKGKATNTLLSAQLPKQLVPMKASEPNQIVENRVVWVLGTLEPGASRIVEMTVKALEKGEHCFTVDAEANDNARTQKSFCTKFAGTSAMTLEMFGKEGTAFLGHKVRYEVKIRNQASESLTNVHLRVLVPPKLKAEKANVVYEAQDPVAAGQWLIFKPLPKLDGQAQVRYEITVEAMQAGVSRFHIEVTADQLERGPVVEEEITNVVDDREKVKVKELSRTREP